MSPTFSDLGVAPDAVADLAARGITTPFPIQALTVPDALAGRDVSGRAPTGSGKTLAFGLALVARAGRARPHRPTGLVLVPTRELAAQVAGELALLSRSHGHRVHAIYGGVGFGGQLTALRRGVELLVACPGRLADLVERGDIRLDDVTVAVVDEADRMADMGFLPEVRRLLDRTSSARQTLLFSATLDGDVDVLVRRYQRDPVRHAVADVEDATSTTTHLFWAIGRDDRIVRTAEIASAAGPTIVFCRTKHGADRTARRLTRDGVKAVAIHGDRSQSQREQALRAFSTGRADVLVATDVAARGIHVDGVAAIVHLDPPADAKDYVHRSGRTARAGAAGTVITLVEPSKAKDVAALQRTVGLPVGTSQPDLAAIAGLSRPAPERVVPIDRNPERSERGGPRVERRPQRPARRRAEHPVAPGSRRSSSAHPPSPRRAHRAPQGRVKFFDPRKGYGFIERHGAPDLFVHKSALAGIATADLTEGRPVAYEVEPGRRGEQAANVRVV